MKTFALAVIFVGSHVVLSLFFGTVLAIVFERFGFWATSPSDRMFAAGADGATVSMVCLLAAVTFFVTPEEVA